MALLPQHEWAMDLSISKIEEYWEKCSILWSRTSWHHGTHASTDVSALFSMWFVALWIFDWQGVQCDGNNFTLDCWRLLTGIFFLSCVQFKFSLEIFFRFHIHSSYPCDFREVPLIKIYPLVASNMQILGCCYSCGSTRPGNLIFTHLSPLSFAHIFPFSIIIVVQFEHLKNLLFLCYAIISFSSILILRCKQTTFCKLHRIFFSLNDFLFWQILHKSSYYNL